MTEYYLIFFNQQWVGDHDEEWFRGRVPTSRAVVEDMKAAGVLVFAGGLVEDLDQTFSADHTSGTLTYTNGPFAESKEWLGGFTVIAVETEEQARYWGGRVAEGCGWPQEIRPIGGSAMRGDRTGQHSIRINQQWRICFTWTPAGPENVEIVDYH